jgi:hypothetical protein
MPLPPPPEKQKVEPSTLKVLWGALTIAPRRLYFALRYLIPRSLILFLLVLLLALLLGAVGAYFGLELFVIFDDAAETAGETFYAIYSELWLDVLLLIALPYLGASFFWWLLVSAITRGFDEVLQIGHYATVSVLLVMMLVGIVFIAIFPLIFGREHDRSFDFAIGIGAVVWLLLAAIFAALAIRFGIPRRGN